MRLCYCWVRAQLLRIDRIMGLVCVHGMLANIYYLYSYAYMYARIQQTEAQLRTAFESLMTATGDVLCVCLRRYRREKLLVVRRCVREKQQLCNSRVTCLQIIEINEESSRNTCTLDWVWWDRLTWEANGTFKIGTSLKG